MFPKFLRNMLISHRTSEIDQEVKVKIIDINEDDKRISLSIKELKRAKKKPNNRK